MNRLVLLLAAGCSGTAAVDTGLERDLALTFALDGPEIVAGEKMGMTLTLADAMGEVEPDSVTITSDVEDPLSVNADGLRPYVAGRHDISVVVRRDGQTWQASAPLSVLPAAPSALSVALTPHETVVGEPAVVQVALTDAFGNVIPADGVIIAADRPELSVGAGVVQTTTPGWFAVTASLGDLVASDVLRVHPGRPASVSLDIVPRPPGLGDTARVHVAVADRYGNPTDSPWTLTADPPGSSTITHRHVRFDAEGWHTLTVAVDGTDLTDTIGPFLIDGTPPELVVTDPPRGTRTELAEVVVAGTVTDAWSSGIDLTVGGVSTVVERDGFFAMPWPLDWGMTVIETEAVDDSGNATSDTRAVLSGAWMPVGGEVTRGIEVRLEDGAGGLGELEALAASRIGDADLGAYVPSPVYDDVSESCFDPCPIFDCEVCVTWYALTLDARDPDIGWTSLDIDPRADGTLGLSFVAGAPSMTWSADAVVAEIDISGSGFIEADSIAVDAVVRPVVRDGRVDVELVSTSAVAHGFDFHMDSWLFQAVEWFGVPVDKWVRDYMVDAIEDAVVYDVAPYVAEALQTLELAYPVPLGEHGVTVTAAPRDIVVDDRSVAIALGTRTELHGGPRPPIPSFHGEYTRQAWTPGMPAAVGLSMDFANQVLAAAWAAGAMDLEKRGSALGLPDVNGLLPGVDDPWLVVTPVQPPIVLPAPDGTARLQVGDLRVEVHDGPPSEGDVPASLVVRAYVSADAIAAFSVRADGSLGMDVDDVVTWFDVVFPDTGTLASAATEDLLSTVVPLLLPLLGDSLSGVELPSLMGLSLAQPRLSEEDGVVVLEGSLQPAP